MNQHTIALGVCGTFGSPNGFQQCFYQPTPFSRSLDLDSKALEVYPGTPLFMLRRDGPTNTVCLAAYSSAREPQSSRRGTFIGSAIILPAGQFSAEALRALIEELHKDVISTPQNMVDGVLQVSQAVALTVAEPHSLKAAEESLQTGRQRDVSVVAGQVALVGGAPNQLALFLQYAFSHFAYFDTLYFTANTDTQRGVAQKGLVPVLTWQQLESEKEAIIAAEKEAIRQAAGAKKAAVQKSRKESLPAGSHSAFEPWDAGAQWNRKQQEQYIKEHNELLVLYQRLAEQFQKTSETGNHSNSAETPRRKRRLNYYKMAFFGLVLFGLGASSYLFYAHSQQHKMDIDSAIAIAEKEKLEQSPLEPAPNGSLDSLSRTFLFPQGVRGVSADSITSVVFANRPGVTAEIWPNMQARYRNALMAANEDCFVGSGNTAYCICDSLSTVPIRQQESF